MKFSEIYKRINRANYNNIIVCNAEYIKVYLYSIVVSDFREMKEI